MYKTLCFRDMSYVKAYSARKNLFMALNKEGFEIM